MAVYTEVSTQEAAGLMLSLGLGELSDMQGCKGGIENTNYFVSTRREGRSFDYVLTLFERLSLEQLPFYLRLMKHLSERGICLPTPHADAQGELAFTLKGKPAAVVDKLQGSSELAPQTEHCRQVGAMLAHMHLAGADFELRQPNLRGLAWWNTTVAEVLPYISPAQAELMQDELAYQNRLASGDDYASLPRGPIHADLFRDNVMFTTVKGEPRLSGFFDFYFAGIDSFLFDIAVCLNDWCTDWEHYSVNPSRTADFLQAYQHVRPMSTAEHALLPAMLRAAALRFWLSRLWDLHLPRQASLLKAHDPVPFERLLLARRAQATEQAHSTPIGSPCT